MSHVANLVRLVAAASMLLGVVSFRAARAQLDPAVAAQVERAVVQLSAWAQGTEDGEPTERVLPRGSGTIVSPDGLILTNHHVVDLEKAREQWAAEVEQARLQGGTLELEPRETFVVSLVSDPAASAEPDRRYTATVVVDRPEYDLAVLRITGGPRGQALRGVVNNLSFVELGDSDALTERQQLHLFGYPFSLPGLVPSEAVVSRLQEQEGVPGWAWIIVSNATITGGNSGGAAVDDAGRLVGVPTAVTALECPDGGGGTDESVGCIPAGGSFGRLRPINLARPLLQEAGLPIATLTATPAPTTAPGGPVGTADEMVAMFRGGAARTGEQPGPGPQGDPTERWRFVTEAPVSSSPVVLEDVVYVGSDDGALYALDARTGEQVWKFQTESFVQSSPAVADGAVYVGSSDGNVYSIDAASGQERWRRKTASAFEASPALVDGVVYVAGRDSFVRALDAATGDQRWEFGAGDRITSSPAVVDGTVFVGSLGHAMYALGAGDGKLLWKTPTNGAIVSTPAVSNGVVYVGSEDKLIYALDAGSGRELWSVATGAAVHSSPAVVGGALFIGSADGFLYKLDATDGEELFKYQTGGPIYSSPSVAGGVVYVASDVGAVEAIDVSSGEEVWSFEFEEVEPEAGRRQTSSPALADGILYVGSSGGAIYAIGGDSSSPANPPTNSPAPTNTASPAPIVEPTATTAAADCAAIIAWFEESTTRLERTFEILDTPPSSGVVTIADLPVIRAGAAEIAILAEEQRDSRPPPEAGAFNEELTTFLSDTSRVFGLFGDGVELGDYFLQVNAANEAAAIQGRFASDGYPLYYELSTTCPEIEQVALSDTAGSIPLGSAASVVPHLTSYGDRPTKGSPSTAPIG